MKSEGPCMFLNWESLNAAPSGVSRHEKRSEVLHMHIRLQELGCWGYSPGVWGYGLLGLSCSHPAAGGRRAGQLSSSRSTRTGDMGGRSWSTHAAQPCFVILKLGRKAWNHCKEHCSPLLSRKGRAKPALHLSVSAQIKSRNKISTMMTN